MKVKDLMISEPKYCRSYDSLNSAAKLMWDHDCGSVPVTDENRQVLGMLTDRDVCMAAYIQGASLKDLSVSSAMSKQVIVCKAEDEIGAVEQLMRHNKIRRLPVVDGDGRLIGIISLNDIAREAERERMLKVPRRVSDAEVTQTLASVCGPHGLNARPT